MRAVSERVALVRCPSPIARLRSASRYREDLWCSVAQQINTVRSRTPSDQGRGGGSGHVCFRRRGSTRQSWQHLTTSSLDQAERRPISADGTLGGERSLLSDSAAETDEGPQLSEWPSDSSMVSYGDCKKQGRTVRPPRAIAMDCSSTRCDRLATTSRNNDAC